MRQTKQPLISTNVLARGRRGWPVLLALMFVAGCARTGMLPTRSAEAGWAAVPDILRRIVPPQFPDRDYVVADFGAVGDGHVDCRPAFAKAIDQCNIEGGGRVIVPAGRYLMNGPIHLKSNVNLHLAKGAYIKFSTNPADYLPVVLIRWEGTEMFNYSPLVYAYQSTNVAITGAGTIDGSGAAGFVPWKKIHAPDVNRIRTQGETGAPLNERIFGEGYHMRPDLVQLFGCKNVLIEGVTMLDSPMWVNHLVSCINVTMRRVKVDSHNPNSDGVDPESCVDMLIEDCVFNCEDDGVAIKSGRDRDGWRLGQPSENIIVRRCKINTYCGGLCVGSEMSGGARNIYWEDCMIEGGENGLFIKANADRGGRIENVWVRNIKIGPCRRNAIHITCNYDGYYKGGYRGNKFYPLLQRMNIENIKAGKAGEEGLRLFGMAELPMREISLKNVSVESQGRASQYDFLEGLTLDNVIIGDEIQTVPGAK